MQKQGYQPLLLQPGKGRLVKRCPGALLIGAVEPAHAGALVPGESQPLEVSLHLLRVPSGTAGGIQILDAQHHPSPLLPGAEPGQEAAEDISQME